MKPNRAAKHAEAYGSYVSQPIVDAEEDALRAEFADLDLTDTEFADLTEAWRLRRRSATNAERIASRAYFDAVRQSLKAALDAQVAFLQNKDGKTNAVAEFARDELAWRQRIEVAMLRPCSVDELAELKAQLVGLAETHDERRRTVVGLVRAGDRVEPQERSAAIRVYGRDGLAELFDRGKVNRRQLMAGLTYRKRYEASARSLGSSLGNEGFGGVTSPLKMVAQAQRSAKWEIERRKAEVAVLRGLRSYPDALRLLRMVAGEGHSITSQVGNGRAFKRGVDVLCLALDVAERHLPNEG